MGSGQEERAIAAAVYKALKRPEILSYMRLQLLESVAENLRNLTTEEIDSLIAELQYEQTKKTR